MLLSMLQRQSLHQQYVKLKIIARARRRCWGSVFSLLGKESYDFINIRVVVPHHNDERGSFRGFKFTRISSLIFNLQR